MKNNYLVCDEKTCGLPATHALVWTKQQNYCGICANRALGIAEAMGFPTPANTVRELSPDEMIQDDSEDSL